MSTRFASCLPLAAAVACMSIAFAAEDGGMKGTTKEGMDMPMESPGDAELNMSHPMQGLYGSYVATQEASGTSWQPASTPPYFIERKVGDWMLMFHGFVNGIYDRQGGPRGGSKWFSNSMGMVTAQRSVGPGTLGLRSMVSLDPAMGRRGYPLLLATGETADGLTPLIDRQHPHDFFMELAASYSVPLSSAVSAFLYLGYPGEPALGPPAFMHRYSGVDNPEAPISHHWFDSTHIVFGVVTAGVVVDKWKIEGSLFTGREPDQKRWNFDRAELDSASARLSFNPTPNWALQVSYGHLHRPERLEPEVNENRLTASASYNKHFGDDNWSTTVGWSRKANHPGKTLNGLLVESALTLHDTHTVFGRAERIEEAELFEAPSPLTGRAFGVNKVSLGYVYDLHLAERLKLGIGGLGSTYALPKEIRPAYGGTPSSFMLFVRLKLG